jgi:hypothetical protein
MKKKLTATARQVAAAEKLMGVPTWVKALVRVVRAKIPTQVRVLEALVPAKVMEALVGERAKEVLIKVHPHHFCRKFLMTGGTRSPETMISD